MYIIEQNKLLIQTGVFFISEKGIDFFTNYGLVYRRRSQKEFDEQDCYTMIKMINAIQQKIHKARWGNVTNGKG